MKPSTAVKSFTERYPFVGPAFWIVSIQYYLVQLLVAGRWQMAYSWLHNTISDLGNTQCAVYASRSVCSPWHNLMNGSFIVLGLTMIIGAVLVYQEFRETVGSLVAFGGMAVAGLGTILVGLFPENSLTNLHFIGALLPFLIGNLGILLFGIILTIPSSLRVYTLISAFVSLIALSLFVTHQYLGLGIGGMERLTAYPQTMWLIVFGIYISNSHLAKQKT